MGARLVTVIVVVYGRWPPSLSMTTPPTVRVEGPSARKDAGTVADVAVVADAYVPPPTSYVPSLSKS